MNTHSLGSITDHLVTLTVRIVDTLSFAYVIMYITFFIHSFTFIIWVTPYKLLKNCWLYIYVIYDLILLWTQTPLEISQVIFSPLQSAFCVHFGLHMWSYWSHFSFTPLHSVSELHSTIIILVTFFYNFVLTMNTQSFGSITGHLITITINILCTFWSAYMIIRITYVIYSFTFRIRETSLINIMISITLFVIHVL